MTRLSVVGAAFLACSEASAAPPVADAGPAPDASALAADAERCFQDPACPMPRAVALLDAADAAGAAGFACFRWYYGLGPAQDWKRARRCFEREVARTPCGGSSPGPERVFLAAMMLDGQGGPRDGARVEALFDDCFEDGTVVGARHPTPWQEPLDPCELAMTTLAMSECAQIEDERAAFEARRVAKEQWPRLDAAARVAYVRAAKAWSAFAAREAAVARDQYRTGNLVGTMASIAVPARHAEMEEVRALAVETLLDWTPRPRIDAAAAAGARSVLVTSVADARKRAQDAEARRDLDAAQSAWTAYRAAELALWRAVHAARFGDAAVTRDEGARLDDQRAWILDGEKVP